MTDLYQLTMAAGYFEKGFDLVSTFELFVRNLPENRSYLVSAGVNQCLEYLQNMSFKADEIEYIRNHPSFKNVSDEFFSYLKQFRFTGDVYAMEEGTLFFPDEPVIRVTAPAIQAQLVETYLLSQFNFQTLIASKAARIKSVAGNCAVIEFGTRRAHSPEAGLLAARAAFVGGCDGTSNVLAGIEYGIPTYGTMAHSWVMAYETEDEAYRAYTDVFPESNALLIDTYDTVEAAKKIVKYDYNVSSVRLDSGNIEKLSKQVREIFDRSGKKDIKIIVSGDLNEYKIKELLEKYAPVDIFGVGTELSTSKDAPALSGVYKLVQQERNSRVEYKAKFSENKKTYPAKKQVYRYKDQNGYFNHDLIAKEDEIINGYTMTLLKPAIKDGIITENFDMNIDNARNRCLESMKCLPEQYKNIKYPSEYPVEISENLYKIARELEKKYLKVLN
jgi:nicotinate phosphoribosyltransferase